MRCFLWFPLRSAVLVLLPLSLAFVHAASGGSLQIFGNNTSITINDGRATPYPSNVTVSGLTVNTATKIQVILSQFSHAYPPDVDVLLVGPQGQRCMLMSDAGGGAPVTNISLTFSSTAATVLPQNSSPGTATYRPANYVSDLVAGDLTDAIPDVGVLTDQAADLNVFNQINPNGVWSLYVADDSTGQTGSITNGWLLLVTVPTVFTVNSTADPGDGVCDATECTLREAINAAIANTGDGDLINFSSLFFDSPQTINLLSALPDITKSITIQGPGANLLTVQRDFNVAASFRIINIASGVANGVAISGMTISNGRAAGGFGGGINCQSNLTLTNVDVAGNQAISGGGVSLALADGVFTGCTFRGNRAIGSGSGIFYEGDNGHTLRLKSSTVSGNQAGDAGIINVSNSGNSSLEVTNSTIANNVAGSSGLRTFASGAGSTATTTLRNSIIANNTPINLGNGTSGGGTATVTTLGFNLASDGGGGFLNVGVTTDKINANAALAPLANYGGGIPSHALLANSAALDAGNSSGITLDQRGWTRPFDTPGVASAGGGGDGADIGAVEMQSLIVTNADDSGAGSLRQAIDSAPTNRDILFDPPFFNVARTILLTGALFINTNLNVIAPGANLVTISGGGASRVFDIHGGITSCLSGITITGGNASPDGGGISNSGTLTVTNSTISGNTAARSGGGIAGLAITVITNSTISGNTANSGTGSAGGGIYNGGLLTITNSTISGNSASNSNRCGGGIWTNGASVNITNCTITNNSAPKQESAPGLFRGGGTVTVRNSIIAVNGGPWPDVVSFLNPGIVSGGFNLIGDRGDVTFNSTGDQSGTFNAPVDPVLGPLQDNGGPTYTHALLVGSPALDAGNNSGSGVLTDQRDAGFGRSVDLAGITNAASSDGTDIGAYEAQSAPTSPTPTPTATPTATPVATATATATPAATPTATATATATATPTATPTPTPGLVGNVSTRLPVGTGDNALIEGFIVQGPAGSVKKILVRAIGPSLIPFGVADAVANPTLEIFDANNTKIASNDNWKTTQQGGIITGDQFAEINGSGVAPSNDLESAIVANLTPGSYTAVVRGANNGVGTGVVDAFDLSAASTAKLANVATRGLIQPGDKLMIGGFIVQNGSVRVVVSALGPSLAAFGITNALPDTTLQLRDQNGVIVRENDDWMSDQKADLEATGLQPTNNLEAALVQTIPPGQYTAQVRGKPEATGTGVVQVFFLQ
jgi:CSLREA domain-containing protein